MASPNEKTAMFQQSRVEEGMLHDSVRLDAVHVDDDEEDWDLNQISLRFGGSDDGMDGSGSGSSRRRSRSTKSSGGFSALSADESIKSWVQSELTELSDFASSPKEDATDNGIMTRTLHDVGSNGYGLQGVSVWLFDHDSDKLVPNGWWHNPSMPKSKALDRLFDPNEDGYVPQKPCLPGVDLAGLLWKESSGEDMAGKHNRDRRSSVFSGSVQSSQRSRSSLFDNIRSSIFQSRGPSIYEMSKPRRKSSSLDFFFPALAEEHVDVLTWRDIKSLINDPYTAKGPRLALLEEAGFCQAAGVREL